MPIFSLMELKGDTFEGERTMGVLNDSILSFKGGLKLLILILVFCFLINAGSLFCQQKGIEYDHVWQWDILENKLKVTVKGFVPFEFVENHIVLGWCPNNKDGSDYFETVASTMEGEATIYARGELLIVDEDDPEEYCHLSFEHPIKVTLKGKTWWKPNDLRCSDETCNFQLDEDWTAVVNWKVKCNDPEQAAMLRIFLPKQLHLEASNCLQSQTPPCGRGLFFVLVSEFQLLCQVSNTSSKARRITRMDASTPVQIWKAIAPW